jgi:Lipopolysaccharide-assembly
MTITRRFSPALVWALAVLAITPVAASGCGYSLAGRGSFLPAYIRTIGLPTFVNNTPVFEVERTITDRVRSELIGRGSYTILPDRTGVDAVLTGEILNIGLAPAAFNQQQQATRYAVTIVAKIEFRDLKTDKVLWQNPALAFTEQYEVTTQVADAATFLGQNQNAVERLASEFARAIVSAILESF